MAGSCNIFRSEACIGPIQRPDYSETTEDQQPGTNWLYAFSHNDPKVAFWGIFPKLGAGYLISNSGEYPIGGMTRRLAALTGSGQLHLINKTKESAG